MYLLAKVALVVGIIGTILCIVLWILGVHYQEDWMVKVGIIGLFISILLAGSGFAVVHFFEETETGKVLVDSSETIVDAGATTVDTIADANKQISDAQSKALEDAQK